MSGKISPSMMCVPLFSMRETIHAFEAAGIEYLHMDVMDGSFVPNYMLGTDFIKQMRKLSPIPLDIHLMVDKPEDKLDWFDIQPGELVSFHYEATNHAQRLCAHIRQKAAKPFIALNPGTPVSLLEDVLPDIDGVLIMTVNPGFAGQKLIPQTIDKTARLKVMLLDAGYHSVEIEADGNMSCENAKKLREAGADIFVAGSSGLFLKGRALNDCIRDYRDCIL